MGTNTADMMSSIVIIWDGWVYCWAQHRMTHTWPSKMNRFGTKPGFVGGYLRQTWNSMAISETEISGTYHI